MNKKIACFKVNGKDYGMPINVLKHVIEKEEHPITRMPQVFPSLEGIINYEGEILPVVSLDVLFGKNINFKKNHTKIIVIEIPPNGSELGFSIEGDINIIEDNSKVEMIDIKNIETLIKDHRT